MSLQWTPATLQPWGQPPGDDYHRSRAEWSQETRALKATASADAPALWDLSTCSAATISLHLAGTPIQQEGIRTVAKPQRIRIPDACRLLEVEIASGTAALILLEGRLATGLRLALTGPRNQPRPRLQLAASGAIATCELRDLNLRIVRHDTSDGEATPLYLSRLLCENAGLDYAYGHAGRLELAGTCDVELAHCEKTRVQVMPAARVRLKNGEELRGIGVSEPRDLSVRDRTGFTLRSDSAVKVRDLTSLRINLESTASIRARSLTSCAFSGSGQVDIAEDGNDVAFLTDEMTLTLSANAQVQDVVGAVTLVPGTHGLLAGKPAAALAAREAPLTLLQVNRSEGHSIDGLSVVNVRIPVTRNGLRIISMIRDAGTVEPIIHDGLPGRPWISRARGGSSDLQLDVEYGRALADLARSKGAPASTRTYLAACAYRLRQRSCGRLERWVLRAYGLLGYGEVFLPPALTFFGVSLLLTGIGLAANGYGMDLTGEGVRLWVSTLADWLTSPLHLLKLTQPQPAGSKFREPFDVLARLLVAIPFTVAVIALRNFVKEDHRSKS